WLLGVIANIPEECQHCRATLSRDHAAECVGAHTKLRSIISASSRSTKLRNLCRQQSNAIDAALAALRQKDMAAAIKIALVIDKVVTQCLGRRSLVKRLTPSALE
ncbi:hypothetical protein EV174_006063, partial [Coemansia sp. RSA 2320]